MTNNSGLWVVLLAIAGVALMVIGVAWELHRASRRRPVKERWYW